MLDLCTGTGCIALLFHHQLYAARGDVELRALGIDISSRALHLALHNLTRLRGNKTLADTGSVAYMRANVLANPFESRLAVSTALRYARVPHLWDILISNPPYISPTAYWKTTTRSVRTFEPKLALVPPPTLSPERVVQGDEFYLPLFDIAREVEAKIVLLEVADIAQALRVARAARAFYRFDGIEIWREQPDEPDAPSSEVAGFRVLGQGNARSVLCWRGTGAAWLGKSERAAAYEAVAFSKASLEPQFEFGPVKSQIEVPQTYWTKLLDQRRKNVKHNLWRDRTSAAAPETLRPKAAEKPQQTLNSLSEDGQHVTQTLGIPQSTVHSFSKRNAVQIQNDPKLRKRSRCDTSKTVISYHEAGLGVSTIADRLGITRAYVYQIFRGHSISSRSKKEPRITKHAADKQSKVLEYYKAGSKVSEIADELGITRAYVYHILSSQSITLRSKMEGQNTRRSKVLEYYKAGSPVPAIVDKLGISRVHVYNILKRHSVPLRNKTKPRFIGNSACTQSKVLEYHKAGLKVSTIADTLEISKPYVYYVLSRHSIPLRRKHSAESRDAA